MEAGKQSASSFTSDLFGAKDSSSSSKILSSIFATPPKVSGGESLHLSENEKNNGSVTQASTTKTPILGEEKDNSSYYKEQETLPFHYSSSIYYGGQDVYTRPQSSDLNPGVTSFNQDVGEDDSGSASRGNWWQGSLYY